jgi:hypothetical protein
LIHCVPTVGTAGYFLFAAPRLKKCRAKGAKAAKDFLWTKFLTGAKSTRFMFGLSKKKQETPKFDEIAIIIDRLEKITSGRDTRNDWEDLFSIQFDDKRAEALRLLFHQVFDAFQTEGTITSSSARMDILKAILTALKTERTQKDN